MFTGIIESLGIIRAIGAPSKECRRISLECPFANIMLGESIAINGVCLTVMAQENHLISFDISSETLACTSLGVLKASNRVNLERAMLPTTRFGGHIVSGHVDTLATIASMTPCDGFYTVAFKLTASYLRYIVKKGSITVDGCSLTINAVSASGFSVMIIPHTWEHTVFNTYKEGGKVNIEVDMIARYVERLMGINEAPDSAKNSGPIVLEKQSPSPESYQESYNV